MKLKIDRFVLSVIVVIGLAYLFPQWGIPESKIPIDTISAIGISLIFFFYGLKLSPSKLKDGLKNWRLHLLVQASTFLIFPLLVLLFRPLIQNGEQEIIWLAFFFLAALPSTVSSSVVMVSIAKGNIPAAIFNASISGIIGVLLTPLWMGLFVKNAQTEFDFADIYLQLIVQIILPVLLGVVLQRLWGEYAQKYGKQLTLFDKSVILLIIYKSFARSFDENIFNAISFLDLLIVFIAVLALFFILYVLTGFLAKKLKFNTEDQITAQFCGTKKSLVHGTVFAKIIFGNAATIGIILLPLMLFHALQLLVISVLASKMGDKNQAIKDGSPSS
ncbi:bile acid:sodium symporter family protein [Zobellia galactanivorans]|uniref:bile acid:sodium symporter family protein n=1 Tax=Zobellia galactanivorans (strain DSM 12802 / CCUG 47099 / CIP 106680 / NCIMB 13871 / Dsij) TaxID=63186 RepID=UPI0026E20E5D|nr:bile acid:sodium symporter family protein [Zobellia galactanivorans]MDO6808942.1 bile acid:sodium symporter family protein [Zobellia galactanivorans]